MGYDRPLDFVFCSIERDGKNIYSNLWDPNAGTTQKDVNYFRAILDEFNVTIPEQMLTEVESDRRLRAGNRVMNWT